ncbi:MAG: site-specific integrase [Blastocatellia bacterium]|nr:site-specific integrase [Blastocatellia bacterium]
MKKENKGYVFEENGKWYARTTVRDENGKRRNIKRTAKSKAEAKELLKQIIRQLDDEGTQAIETWSLTFNDLANYCEKHYAIPAKIVENTKIEGLRDLRRVKTLIGVYRQFFGSKKLREITYNDVRAFRTIRLNTPTPSGKQRTITTVNRELAYLRRIFNIALQNGWILKNPFNCGSPLILTSCERRRERILSFDEEIRLLEACNHPQRQHLKPLLIALLDTGARKGEMLKLQWRDVDLVSGTITFQALNTKTLKTRTVGITQRLANELVLLWQQADKLLDSTVLGLSDNVTKSFKTACGIAGIKHGGIDGLTLHCLRHTTATRLVNDQLPIQMVGRILGHTQVNTTYRYLTATIETARKATNILESFQNQTATQLDGVADYVN